MAKQPKQWRALIWRPLGIKKMTAVAHTKSEARAILKRELGIPKKGRLPDYSELL